MPSRFQHANQSNSEGRKCPPPRADSAAPEHDVISAEAVLRALLAEVVGTFALTFVAAGGVVIGALSEGAVSAASRAVAPGLVVLALIYAIGNDSGAHYNPSVTLAFALRRAFQWRWVTPYWAAQVIGAVAAALLLRMLFGTAKDIGATHPHYGTTVALVMEIVLTFLLVLVILGTATRYSLIGTDAALAVGATIACEGLFAAPVSGASMNPARSLGPALVSGAVSDLWVYLVGPFAGAALAVVATAILHRTRHPWEKEAAQGEHLGTNTRVNAERGAATDRPRE
jgi:MIP family channel proteins